MVLANLSVLFSANTAAFIEGLTGMKTHTKNTAKQIKADFKAAGDDLANIGKIAAAAGAAIYSGLALGVGKSVVEISKIKDEANKIGISAQNFMQLSYAAKTTGTDAETVKRSFVEMQKSINDSSNASQIAFLKLGIDVNKFKQLNPKEQYDIVVNGLNQITDKNEKAAIGMSIFGKTFTEMKPMIDGGVEGLQQAAVESAKLGQSLSDDSITSVKALGENFEWLGNAVTGAFNIVAAAIAPTVNDIIEKFKSWAMQGTNFSDAIKTGLEILVTPIYMIVKGFDLLMAAFYGLKAAGGVVVTGIYQTLSLIVTGVDKLFVQPLINGFNLAIKAWNALPFTKKQGMIEFSGISQMADDLGNAAVETAKQAGDDWATAGEYSAGKYSEAFLNKVTPIINNVSTVAQKAIESVGTNTKTGTPAGMSKTVKDVTLSDSNSKSKIYYLENQKEIDQLLKKGERIRENMVSGQQQRDMRIKEIEDIMSAEQKYFDANGGNQDLLMKRMSDYKKAIGELKTEYFLNFTAMGRATGIFVDSFSDGFAEIMTSGEGFGKKFTKLFENILIDIEKDFLSSQLKNLFKTLMNSWFSSSSGSTSIFSSIASAFSSNAASSTSTPKAAASLETQVSAADIGVSADYSTGLYNMDTSAAMASPTINYTYYSYDTEGMQQMIERNRPKLAQDAVNAWAVAKSRRQIS